MEPQIAAAAGLLLGLSCALVAFLVDRARWHPTQHHAQDFYVMGWWALAATAFLNSTHSALVWGGIDRLALSATLRLSVVLAFVLAAAALVAAAGHLMTASTAVKTQPSRRRAP